MVKGTIKRALKRLQTITHESRRRNRRITSHPLSDHRAVALAEHYIRIGFNTTLKLHTPEGAFTRPNGDGSPSATAPAEASAADPGDLDRQAAKIMAAGDSGAAFLITRAGKIALFDRAVANA